MTEDEFIRFLNETLELISSHAAGGAIVYACMDWRTLASRYICDRCSSRRLLQPVVLEAK
jgi:hypothetical protein